MGGERGGGFEGVRGVVSKICSWNLTLMLSSSRVTKNWWTDYITPCYSQPSALSFAFKFDRIHNDPKLFSPFMFFLGICNEFLQWYTQTCWLYTLFSGQNNTQLPRASRCSVYPLMPNGQDVNFLVSCYWIFTKLQLKWDQKYYCSVNLDQLDSRSSLCPH